MCEGVGVGVGFGGGQRRMVCYMPDWWGSYKLTTDTVVRIQSCCWPLLLVFGACTM